MSVSSESEPTNERVRSLAQANSIRGKFSENTLLVLVESVTTMKANKVHAETTKPSLFRKRGTGFPTSVAVKAHTKERHVASPLNALVAPKQMTEKSSFWNNVCTSVIQNTT